MVLPTWVGDCVMATPFLRAMRERYSQAEIVFLIEPNLRELVRGGDWMDSCCEWPAKEQRSPLHRSYRELVARLRQRRFDWAVLLPNSFRSAMLARLSGARRRIGYDRDGRGWLLTDRVPVRNRVNGRYEPLPIVDYYADLAEALGCARPGDKLELFTTTDEEAAVAARLDRVEPKGTGPLVVISPGAKYGLAKCWLPERFAGVGRRLIEKLGATVLVTCGPGEEALAREIGGDLRPGGHVLDDPRLSLGELKALIKRCDLLICNDTGPRHFGKAFGVPAVTVFGPTHPEWTRTSHACERIVRVEVDCGPCQQRLCPLGHLKCMTEVTVEAVEEAACDLLATPAVSD